MEDTPEELVGIEDGRLLRETEVFGRDVGGVVEFEDTPIALEEDEGSHAEIKHLGWDFELSVIDMGKDLHDELDHDTRSSNDDSFE